MLTFNYHEVKVEVTSLETTLDPKQFARLQHFVAETTKAFENFGKKDGCRYAKTQYALCLSQKCYLCESMICSCGNSHCLNMDSSPITSLMNHATMDTYRKIQACHFCSKRRVCYPCSGMIEYGLLRLPCCENTPAQCR